LKKQTAGGKPIVQKMASVRFVDGYKVTRGSEQASTGRNSALQGKQYPNYAQPVGPSTTSQQK
jgi:hypothetical protein